MSKVKHVVQSQLSPSQIETVYQAYVGGQCAKSIVKEFDLPISPRYLHYAFPDWLTGEDCPNCCSPLYAKRPGLDKNAIKPAYCNECGHKDRLSCTCSHCNRQRANKRMRTKSAPAFLNNDAIGAIGLGEVSLIDKVLLHAILASSDLRLNGDIKALRKWGSLPPFTGDQKSKMKQLLESHALTVSPDTPRGAPGQQVYPLDKVLFRLNVHNDRKIYRHSDLLCDLVNDFRKLKLSATTGDKVFRLMVLNLVENVIVRVSSNRFDDFKLTQSLSDALFSFIPDLTVHKLLHFVKVASMVVLNRTPSIACKEFNHALERVITAHNSYPENEVEAYIYMPSSVLIEHTMPAVLNVDLDRLLKMPLNHYTADSLAR